MLRIGTLKKLPAEYEGERHIVIVAESSTGWCEFEERPEPDSVGVRPGEVRVYLSEDEARI